MGQDGTVFGEFERIHTRPVPADGAVEVEYLPFERVPPEMYTVSLPNHIHQT